jgi:DNA-binding MarR family transcriptional regulator
MKLTDNEKEVIDCLKINLKAWIGHEDFSDIDCKDIAEQLKIDVKSVKGIVGSLVKKGILETFPTGTGYECVLFANQKDMKIE